jgi:dTDP-4-amino-4,6-dideoxygalactose transaminase
MTPSSIKPRPIPITDLGLEYESIKKDLDPLLEKILRSGSYILGSEVGQFEKDLAAYIGVRHAMGVNSGTDAILIALRALDIKAGDEVILPAMSFFATVEPIVLLGAKPVFVDIDPVTYAIDAAAVAARITPRTKAIIAVHLYGLSADMKALTALAAKNHIPLVEDMAQAIGASFESKKVGAWGDIACLSFYPTKNLGACGDSGAVLTSSDPLAERVKSLRNHGAKIKYHHEEVAYNSRMDEIQAAVLRLKLPHLDAWNEKRRALAHEYTAKLQGLPITLPKEVSGRHHIFPLYSIASERRDDLKAFLQAQEISTGLHYPIPLHLLPALQSLGHHAGDFPVSEKLASQTLSLPLYPFMSIQDVHRVTETVRKFFQPRV